MKPTAARELLLAAVLTAAVVGGGCSVSELGLAEPDRNGADVGREAKRAEPPVTVGGRSAGRIDGPADDDGGPTEVGRNDVDGDDGAEATTSTLGPDEVPAPAGPRLSVDPTQPFRSSTCYQPRHPGADPAPVGCDEPHRIEVFSTHRLRSAQDTSPPTAEVAGRLCDQDFVTVTGVSPELAAVFDRLVIRPSERTWALGEREVICYVVFPEPTALSLAEVDPARAFGLASLHGLRFGDCLIDFAPAQTRFELVECAIAHDAEVFVALELPPGPFPGDEVLEALADDRCFGAGFTDFVGLEYSRSVIQSLKNVPTAGSWAFGHRTINCIATDGLVRNGSLAGLAR